MSDVAAQAGVSRVTASVVLNDIKGSTRVSAETRARIHAVAAAMHYRPNAVARSLRDRTTNLIGVYNNGGWIALKHPFFNNLISGLYGGCFATGKSLLLHTPPLGQDADAVFMDLASRPIDGLIVKTLPTDPVLSFLRESHVTVVAMVDALPGICSVVADDVAGATAIAEHLHAKGHQRVLYLISDLPHTSVVRRHRAFCEWADEQGMQVETESLPDGGALTLPDAFHTRFAADRGEWPTAIVCWNDQAAGLVNGNLAHKGLQVGKDIAVVGYDDSTAALLPDGRRLTTVAVDWEAVAQRAVRNLVAILQGETVPEETVLPVRFVPGDTT
jgi:DNA-binding LacI/PurR family transcriptional regulator